MSLVLEKKITYAEFRQMEFDENDPYIYELINGELMRKSAPKPNHQAISRRILVAIELFIRQHQIGEIFYSPIDVFLNDYNVPQPDLVFIAKDNAAIVDYDEGIIGIPDLVVEIISPSSVKTDRVDKKILYEKFKIKEYWIVDPNNTSIEIYKLDGNSYVLHQFEAIEGKITSPVLTNFEIELKDIFN